MTLLTLAEKIGEKCTAHAYTLTTAESITAGGVSYWLTAVPGSSKWFECAFICYSETAKQHMLDVKTSTLQQYGAVSELCAREMAESALKKSHATLSLAVTGIAGPESDSSQNPVGTVWFALASLFTSTISMQYLFTGTRAEIREKTIKTALEEILKLLK